jgi:AcrR family transcriptional regulator
LFCGLAFPFPDRKAGGLFSVKKSASKIDRGISPAIENSVSGLSSKEKLLRSAEVLFSTKEFREVSVREIAAHAGINSALVVYYFNGKQALFEEVFRIHAAPLSRKRMKRLKIITKNGRKPSVEEILKAWLLPWLRLENNQNAPAIHLGVIANLSNEKWKYAKKDSRYMQRTHNAFIEALYSCLPYLSTETLMWRLHFVIGALVFGIRQPASLLALSGGCCDSNNLEAAFDQILPYAVAGFRAGNPFALTRSK